MRLLQTKVPNLVNKKDSQDNKNYALVSNDLLPAVAHELKTPLSAIVSFSDSLQEELQNPQSKEECLNYAREINSAALDLMEVVNDLLDIKGDGFFKVNLSDEIDLKDVIKRAIRLNYDYALRRNIIINSDIADNLNGIRLDKKRMKQILTNLISNAIKYSPKHSEVKITAKIENNILEIIVLDHGFGMSQIQVKRAFQKYETIKNPNSDKVDSFGLGLAIVKELVELQKGKIEIKSELNKGTKIKLSFPLYNYN